MIEMLGVPDSIIYQNMEFDAVQRLVEQYRRIQLTAVVDDDYPDVRRKYEAAMRDLIDAIRLNGRLGNEERETQEADCGDREEGGEAVAGIPAEEEKKPRRRRFVAQDWTSQIPMMQQTVLFGIVRGPDGIPKYHPVKPILRWYRRCLLLSALDGEVIENPWDPRGGSFTGPSMEIPDDTLNCDWWGPMARCMDEFMKTMDEMPIHFWLHMTHATEIMGAHHSAPHIRVWWTYVYNRMVHAMHLYPESVECLNVRLGDTREGWLARSDPAIEK